MLPVFDNLERAMQHADSATDVQALADGIRMVSRQFLDTLGKLGIERVVAAGSPFDPSLHEAIQQLESADYAAGVVLAEVQAGYRQATDCCARRWWWCPRGPRRPHHPLPRPKNPADCRLPRGARRGKSNTQLNE